MFRKYFGYIYFQTYSSITSTIKIFLQILKMRYFEVKENIVYFIHLVKFDEL